MPLRSPPPIRLIALLLLAFLACGEQPASEPRGAAPTGAESAATAERTAGAPAAAAEEPGAPGPAPAGSVWVEAVENGGFERIADATTDPPKYGAYWRGAFVPEEGVSDDLIEEVADAAAGRRVLRLGPDDGPVVHKLVADVRWSASLPTRLSWRSLDGGRLVVRLRDGPGEELSVPLDGEGEGWTMWQANLGGLFTEHVRRPPQPRLELELIAEGGAVEVDEVSVSVALPGLELVDVVQRLRAEIQATLELWYLPPDEGGLGLVDPATGYVRANSYDVNTGQLGTPRGQNGLHTIHVLLVDWLALCKEQGWVTEFERWQPRLRTIARTLLSRHFGPDMKLPYGRFSKSDRPDLQQPVTVASWIDFLLDAREVVQEPALRKALLLQARETATTLVKLARAHDLEPLKHPNTLRLNKATQGFEGEFPNWFGALPNRITPSGAIDPPRRYNTSWAILSKRRFWYHMLKSPAAVLRVHALSPREGDLQVVLRALERFERPWDAQRYDLENDTDDHYGYLMKDGLTLLAAARATPPSPARDAILARAGELVYGATDHRLEPEARRADDALWIQAVRLGTACAGDSPRAFAGVAGLIDHDPTHPKVALYREAVLELARNDFRGRQLTNGQFTESFFKHWEMLAICFHGTYQGDCRERPWEEWQGDVGDIFGGPPLSSLLAQSCAWQLAPRERRPEILARFLTILDAADRDLRGEYGYLAGLDPAVALQYGLPPRYTEGLSADTAAGLGTTTALLNALEVFVADG